MKKFFGNLYIVIIMLFLYLPILTLIVLSFNEAKSMSVFTRFSLKWYGEMFHSKRAGEHLLHRAAGGADCHDYRNHGGHRNRRDETEHPDGADGVQQHSDAESDIVTESR